MHQLFIVASLQLLLPVIQTFFSGTEMFNPQKNKSAKIKWLLFSQKPQKFRTAEITGYTVIICIFFLQVFLCSFSVNYRLSFEAVFCVQTAIDRH